MEIETVWGVKWFVAGTRELVILLIALLIIAIVLLLIQFYLQKSKTLSHEFQYVLFHSKNRGLTNFQYKIVRGMAEMLKLKHPMQMIESPEIFEKAIGSFILFLSKKPDTDNKAMIKIFKAIVITYDKLFSETGYKRPLNSIEELSDGHLIYFFTQNESAFIGKLLKIEDGYLKLDLFRKPHDLVKLSDGDEVTCFIWRAGDAEYTFTTTVSEMIKSTVLLEQPADINRGNEVRLPFVNVIIKGLLKLNNDMDESEEIEVTVFKLAEHEVIVRSSDSHIENSRCEISFTMEDFTITAPARIIAEKTVSDNGVSYYTLKFLELSKPAEKVIRNYIYEHI
ncbi:MAG: hypothetical protein JXK07_07585 [Spirochaetes bacterium]|nr:hypothetical protein [Spirochaetota bacterium]MBN2769716.1 hypothetical protein [Spirochaetota bacterium]